MQEKNKTIHFTIFYLLLLVALAGTASMFVITPLTGHAGISFCFFETLRALLSITSLAALCYLVLFLSRTNLSDRLKNVFLFIASGWFFFLLLELIFMFIPRSYGDESALAARLWHRKYWTVNRMGFRDKEYGPEMLAGKKKIFVIGDSYVAGAGIENPSDRFTGVLQQKLPADFHVLNMGIPGASTLDEIHLLDTLRLKPDILILCHYVNDIEYLLPEYPPLKKSRNALTSFLIGRSYFLNFLFYSVKRLSYYRLTRIIHKKIKSPEFETITGLNKKAKYIRLYQDSVFLSKHLQTIHRFIEYSQKNQVPFFMIIFPVSGNDGLIDFTNATANLPISNYLKKEKIPYMNAYPFFKMIPEMERTVSRFDMHPGVKAHQVTGQALFRALKKQKVIE